MEEHILHIITTGLGAMSGAYCAYRIAERRLRRSEKEKFLTLILVVMEHLEHVSNYLDKFDIAKNGETGVNLAIFSEPFYHGRFIKILNKFKVIARLWSS